MRFSNRLLFSLLVSASLAIAFDNRRLFSRQSNNTDYVLKKGPLDTPWTEKVGTNPWPEYPRPLMERANWLNLNGVWRYRNVTGTDRAPDAPPFNTELENPVLVPFCLESALSGTWYCGFDARDANS